MNWGWDAFKQAGMGLLKDPNSYMENPWFRAGMGILSENRQPFGGDPYGAMVAGMKGAKETKEQREDRERIQELRKQLAEWLRKQQGYPQGVQNPDGSIMTPLPQQPPRSIMELYKQR